MTAYLLLLPRYHRHSREQLGIAELLQLRCRQEVAAGAMLAAIVACAEAVCWPEGVLPRHVGQRVACAEAALAHDDGAACQQVRGGAHAQQMGEAQHLRR